MILKRSISKLLMAVMIVSLGCTSSEKKENGSSSENKTVVLEPQDFKSKLASTPDGVLIDVRTPEEVSEGMIEGAINLDFKDPGFKEKMESLDKEKTYFVYCLSGKRSGDAVNLMAEAGFENIYTLKDGLQKWTEEGLETTKP